MHAGKRAGRHHCNPQWPSLIGCCLFPALLRAARRNRQRDHRLAEIASARETSWRSIRTWPRWRRGISTGAPGRWRWSPRLRRLLGLPEGGRSCLEGDLERRSRCWKPLGERLRTLIARALEPGESWDVELSVRARRGRAALRCFGHGRLRDEDGRVVATPRPCKDVTRTAFSRASATKAAQQRIASPTRAANIWPVGLGASTDEKKRAPPFFGSNSTWWTMLGYEPDEAGEYRQTNWIMLVHPQTTWPRPSTSSRTPRGRHAR